MNDRLVGLHIKNLRTIKNADIDFGHMTVLIGENGSGKSTILDAIDFLWRSPPAVDLPKIIGHEAERATIRGRFKSTEGGSLEIEHTLGLGGETHRLDGGPVLTEQDRSSAEFHRAFRTALDISFRTPRHAVDLARSFLSLRYGYSQADWEATLDYVRLGLGFQDVLDVEIVVKGCHVDLFIHFRSGPKIDVRHLSVGHQAYIELVALVRRAELAKSPPAALVIESPEAYLSRELLARAMLFLEDVSQTSPVILTTHSYTLLDYLEDPVSAVVLCDRDSGKTVLRRVDAESYALWSKAYDGLGAICQARGMQYVFGEGGHS